MRVEANKAAVHAVLINKIGDLSFIIGSGLIYFYYKTFCFITLFNTISSTFIVHYQTISFFTFFNLNVHTIIAFLFLISIMAKSAQIGLHTWLPEAMEGPTPVSALIHAATMVTAGIFLAIRCQVLFEIAPIILILMTLIGGLTAFLSSFIALYQNDIKKIIAYSTCSQLGYMLTSCGLSKYNLALYHLLTHGFFKALLFLCAGAILHGFLNNQDIRLMGNLTLKSRYLMILFYIGNLALIGFPFFSGYYSKELLIFNTLQDTNIFFGIFIFILLFGGAIGTCFYTFRLTYLTVGSHRQSLLTTYVDAGSSIFISLTLLAFFSISFGFFFSIYFMNYQNTVESLNFF